MKYNKLPDLDYLRSILRYEAETGKLYWIKLQRKARNVKVGDVAGRITLNGYAEVIIYGKYYLAHRLAYYMYHGVDPRDKQIDHIDCDRSNNKIYNLRLATPSQNLMNTKRIKSNSTGYKCIRVKKYTDHIYYVFCTSIKGKIYSKCFQYTPEGLQEAIAYRDKKLKELHGEFARTE